MQVNVEKLDHPPVYNVQTLDGVAEFYTVFGYRVIVPKGLEGDVIRLEGDLPVPILVFRKTKIKDNTTSGLAIYMKIPLNNIRRIQRMFGTTRKKFNDPNGITVTLLS